jgi:hypothetical protein
MDGINRQTPLKHLSLFILFPISACGQYRIKDDFPIAPEKRVTFSVHSED